MRYFENEQVFALYPEDKTWYPARYVSKNGNKYTVNWLDRDGICRTIRSVRRITIGMPIKVRKSENKYRKAWYVCVHDYSRKCRVEYLDGSQGIVWDIKPR